jgi:hypothetical protein
MKTIIEYLTEDFQSGLQKFMTNYVTPVTNKPPKTIHELQKTRLFEEFAKSEDEILDIVLYDYQDSNPYDRMYNRPHTNPTDYSDFNDYLKAMDDYDESLFVKFIVDSVVDSLNNQIERIRVNIGDTGKLRIYRALLVGEDYLNHLISQGKHLGIYWTLDKNLADVYGSDGRIRHTKTSNGLIVVIEADIHEDYIDWERTLFARIDHEYGDREEEITLFKGTPIKILYLYDKDNGEDFDISTIANKTFYA